MKNYKLILTYDGTRYNGWQRQGNTEKTIQEKVEAHLSAVLGEPVEIAASGRTDAGVHALAQVCSFRTDTKLSCNEILSALSNTLPEDIGAVSLNEVPPRFHARLNAVSKTYVYNIHNSPLPDVFNRKYQYTITQPLDIEAMRCAAELMCGTHDYIGFSSIKKAKKSTVRTVFDVTIRQSGEDIIISYNGTGFLYNMVRIMTGTLIEVGLGIRSPGTISEILESGSRDKAGFTAPACGLFLKEVFY